MFTGIVEDIGKVAVARRDGKGLVLGITPQKLKLPGEGESVSINGACLTVVKERAGNTIFEVSPETLSRTNLNTLKMGDWVNLERALPIDGRFSGHIVQGHVDTTLSIVRIKKGRFLRFAFSMPPGDLSNYVVSKGFVCIDGISLTVSEVEKDMFWVDIIPITFSHTNLKFRRVGDRVNFEADIVLKFIKRLVNRYNLKDEK